MPIKNENSVDSRFGNRSKKQFVKDIKYCTNLELLLAEKYAAYLEDKYPKRFIIIPSQNHEAGEFVDVKNASKHPDFEILDTKTYNCSLFDVKFSDKHMDVLHYKVSHIQTYIASQASIITFMGIGTKDGCMNIASTKDIQDWLITKPVIWFDPWKRICVKIKTKELVWHPIDLRGVRV